MRVASGKSKSLPLPSLVKSHFVSPEVDGCICVVPRSCALIKAALMCTTAASSDLCLRINLPCLMGGKKKSRREGSTAVVEARAESFQQQ